MKDPPDDERLTYDWYFGDGSKPDLSGRTVTRSFPKKDTYSVVVAIKSNDEEELVRLRRGHDRGREEGEEAEGRRHALARRRGRRRRSGGVAPDTGGGGFTGPGPTAPPYDPGTAPPPATPSLPPPSTSPPSDPGRGPDLDPNAPPSNTEDQGEEVEGILVSANVPAQGRPPSAAGGRPTNPQANEKKDDEGIDWKLAGGIALTTLLSFLAPCASAADPAAAAPGHQ